MLANLVQSRWAVVQSDSATAPYATGGAAAFARAGAAATPVSEAWRYQKQRLRIC